MGYYVTAHQVNYDGNKKLLFSASGVSESVVELVISHYGSPLNMIMVSKLIDSEPIIDEQTERECEV